MDVRARDAALERLRRLTLALVVSAGALVALFAGLAAKAFPGRQPSRASTPASPPRRVQAPTRRATPPPLVPVDSGGSAAAAPSPPPAAPTVTPAPPVVVS